MATLFCNECGRSLDPGAKFCTNCGAKAPEIISEETAQETVSEETAQETASEQAAQTPVSGAQTQPDQSSYGNPYNQQDQPVQNSYGNSYNQQDQPVQNGYGYEHVAQTQSVQGSQKRVLLIILLAVVIIAILITGIFLVSRMISGRQDNNPSTTVSLPTQPSVTESAVITETTISDGVADTTAPTETTETSATDANSGELPDAPTWLTPDRLNQADAFTSDQLTGQYTGSYIIRVVENAAGLSDSLSNEHIFSFEEAWQQERPAKVEYNEDGFLYLTLDLPGLGETVTDGLVLALENQPFTNEQSENNIDPVKRTYHYRVLTLPENDQVRLIGRFETTVGDDEARFVVEFDVIQNQDDTQIDDTAQTTSLDPNLIENQDPGLLPAYAYVPEPGNVYLYDVSYVSGEYGLEEVYVGKINDHVLSSVTVYMLDDETYLGEQYDFVSKEDGIYIVYEEFESLWLPHDYEEFSYWETDWEAYMIIAVDQTFEVNGYTFENCLIRSYEISEADYFITEYLAPGHGVVYYEYSPGNPGFELLDQYTVDLETANSYLER